MRAFSTIRNWLAGATPSRVYLAVAPFIYLAFALLTPPFQTPDEHQHLFRAYQLASFQLIGSRRGTQSGGDLPPSLARSAELEVGDIAPHVALRPTPRTSLPERFARATPLALDEPSRFENFLGAVAYPPVGYVPQILAVRVGIGLDLSIETIVRLGRVLNVVLTLTLFAAAFRTLPTGKAMLMLVGLTPMTAACAGSFGQDGLVIGGSVWLTALGLRAVVRRRWPRRDMWVAAALTCIITLAKFVYLPIVGIALLPRPSNVARARWFGPPIACGMCAVILLGLWMSQTSGLIVPAKPGLPWAGEQLAYVLHHPLAFPAAFMRTYLQDPRLGESLFSFGWVNVGPVMSAMVACGMATAVALIYGDSTAEGMTLAWRAWTLLLVFVSILLLSFTLYLAFNPLGAGAIDGIQGRYLLPLALPLLLALLRRGASQSGLSLAAIAILLVIANAEVLVAISRAYYI